MTKQLRSGRRRRRAGDDGFVLLETLVTIGLISVVMAAFTTFFINSVSFTNQQRATQIATQIANSAVDALRALPSSDLVNGRDVASVVAQFSAAPSAVSPWLSSMLQTALEATADRTAPINSGATAAVPTAAVTQTVNKVVYSRSVYLGSCGITAGVTLDATCTLGALSTGVKYLRAVVAVTWAGSRCPPAGCVYVTSTLLSTVDDPPFSLTPSPPPLPTLVYPGAQISAVGDTISLPATITAVPSVRVAVTAGTLPAGLILDTATGRISGTPSAVTSITQLTLTLTDGFDRVTTASFSWTVLAALTTTTPAAQASFIGTSLTLTLPAATGGSPGYTWSDPAATLPPGLSLSTVNNQARITGTPTTRGVYAVTLTVTDSTTTRRSTVSFSWTTDYPPLVVANPGPQTSTINAADSATLAVTGGSGSFTWTGGATLPAGLTLTGAGVLSGTPNTASVTSVVLLVTDNVTAIQQSVPFSWTVYARPTVTSPANRSLTVGQGVSVQLATSCPNMPCSYVLNNGPATFGISSSGLLTGTATGPAQAFNAITVTVTDSSGAAVPSTSFTWTVNAAPSISSPGNQTAPPGTADSLNVAALASGGTAPLTFSASNLPSWLTLNSGTGAIAGTSPSAAGMTTGIILTVTDINGISASSAPFSWTVGGPPTIPRALVVVNGDNRVTPSWTAPTSGTVTSYTATASPGGASCTTAGLSCEISGLTNGVVYSVTVTASNGAGSGPPVTAVRAIPYPAGVMSGANKMTLWLDGADPNVLASGSDCSGAATTSVGCWKDKSGLANNFVQGTTANRPGVGTWNALPAANFADAGDVLNSVNAAAQYQTVLFAANVTNPAGSGVIVNLFGQAGQDYNARIGSLADRRTQSSQNANDWAYNTGNPPQNWANGAQGANAPQPLEVITTDQSASVKSFTASVSNTYPGRGLIGQVGDVITFNKVLTTAERRAVEEYLSNKWGVAITPPAPTAVSAITGTVQGVPAAQISWTAPGSNGGAAITGYTVTSSPGNGSCTSTGTLSCVVTGLSRGTAYTFTVTATNSIGTGSASVASAPVTPQ